ncbi:MAG: hypothetical protein RJB66_99 [Pseudomonadota bacterium]|jgi:hypothetical protein
MTSFLSQYHQRAPRYILLPQDECLIRVAGPKQTPWEEGTEIRNISNSGLCFTAPNILLPKLGEFVRVQFEVPGSKQMACNGRVVRIDKLGVDSSLVGLEFETLTSAQRWNLTRGLKNKVKDEKELVIEHGRREIRQGLWGKIFYAAAGVSLFFATFLLIAVFKVLVNPDWFESLYVLAKSFFVTTQ